MWGGVLLHLTCLFGDCFGERRRQFWVFYLAGKLLPFLPVWGENGQGTGSSIGAIGLLHPLQRFGIQDTWRVLGPGHLWCLIAGQVDDHADQLRALLHIQVSRAWGYHVDLDVTGSLC